MSQTNPLIIDVHGHCTTAPKALEEWRNKQIAGIQDPASMPKVSDLKIRQRWELEAIIMAFKPLFEEKDK